MLLFLRKCLLNSLLLCTFSLLSQAVDEENCTFPEGFSKVPFNFTDLENRCPRKHHNKGNYDNCTVPSWVMAEAAMLVTPERLPALAKVMEKFDSKIKDIVLINTNYEFAFLFINWVCSVMKLGLDARAFTLVIAAEKKSEDLARKMGFHYVSVNDWLGHLKTISWKAPRRFTGGDYKWIAALTNLYLTDLVDLGYSVLVQDADVTWNRNPFLYFKNNPNFDIYLVEDTKRVNNWRRHHAHYDKARNGGFLFYQNNCRTRVYTRTLRNCLVDIFWLRSDQVIMNRLLDSYRFHGIRVGYLPPELFINGHLWNEWGAIDTHPLLWNPYIFHASWTGDRQDKVLKFLSVGQWFSTCEHFNIDLVPEMNITKKLGEYLDNFKTFDSWHLVAEKLAGNLLKPNQVMEHREELKPVLDIYAGEWYPPNDTNGTNHMTQ